MTDWFNIVKRIPTPVILLVLVLSVLTLVYRWGTPSESSSPAATSNTVQVSLEVVEGHPLASLQPVFEMISVAENNMSSTQATSVASQPHREISPFAVEKPNTFSNPQSFEAETNTGDFLSAMPVIGDAVSVPRLTKIEASQINLHAPITEMGWQEIDTGVQVKKVWQIPADAAGWVNNSALPGQSGNIVLSGYNNYGAEVFKNVPNLEQGDDLTLHLDDQPFFYKVVSKQFLPNADQSEETRQAFINWTGSINEERLTLVTAWPYTNSTHLVIVVAYPSRFPSLADNPLPADLNTADIAGFDDDGYPGPSRIAAPSIGLDVPVIKSGWRQIERQGELKNVWTVPDYAAGWHSNSALPGENGNIVLSGHHNIMGQVFRYLVDLNESDDIVLYVDNQPYTYTVAQKLILKEKGEPPEVRRENARWIGSIDEERLTLVTCWPYTSNTHRLIVVARPKTLSL